jgi:hypothetical protein
MNISTYFISKIINKYLENNKIKLSLKRPLSIIFLIVINQQNNYTILYIKMHII